MTMMEARSSLPPSRLVSVQVWSDLRSNRRFISFLQFQALPQGHENSDEEGNASHEGDEGDVIDEEEGSS